MRDEIGRIHAAGAELVVVGSGSFEQAAWFAKDLGLDCPVVTDSSRRVFRAFQTRRSFWRVLHPGTLWSAVRAWRRGFRQDSVQGDALQLGGVFVITPGPKLLYAHRSRFAGDHPPVEEVLSALGASGATEDRPLPPTPSLG